MADASKIARRIVHDVLTQHARHDDGPKGDAARAELDRRRAVMQAAVREAWARVGEACERTRSMFVEFAAAFAEGQRRATRIGVTADELDAFEAAAREVGRG